jgi:hypothetical protein
MSSDIRKSENENEHTPDTLTEKQEEKITDLPFATSDEDAQQVKGGVVRSNKDL